jgi:hypothetical protein
MKITIFWDVTPCSLVDRYQSFGGTCCLSLQENTVLFWNVGTYLQNYMYHISEDGDLRGHYGENLKILEIKGRLN